MKILKNTLIKDNQVLDDSTKILKNTLVKTNKVFEDPNKIFLEIFKHITPPEYFLNDLYLDSINNGKKIIIQFYDENDGQNMLLKLNKLPTNKNILLITIGEKVNTFVKNVLNNKFPIINIDVYPAIYRCQQLAINSISEVHPRNKLICNASRAEVKWLPTFKQLIIDRFNIENFYVNHDKKEQVYDYLSQYKVSYEPRYNCCKSTYYSISAGTPIIVSPNCSTYFPNRYIHSNNFRVIDIADLDFFSNTIDELSQVDNNSIKRMFIKDVDDAIIEVGEIFKNTNFNDFETTDYMYKRLAT